MAIKIVERVQEGEKQDAVIRRELDTMAALQHENISRLIEYEKDQGKYYIAMEVLKGGELFDHLVDSNGGFPIDKAASMIRQVRLVGFSFLPHALISFLFI